MNKFSKFLVALILVASVGFSGFALYKADSPIQVSGNLKLDESNLSLSQNPDGVFGAQIAPIFFKRVGASNRAVVPVNSAFDFALGSSTASSSAPFRIDITGDDANGVGSGSWTFQNLTVNGTCTGCAGAVAGSDTQIIFNDGGAYAGDAQFLWNKTSNQLTVTGHVSTSTASISGNFQTSGRVILGDNGDNISFDSNVWDITAAGVGSGFTGFTTTGHFSGATASLSGNFQTSARIISGTASHSFGGTIEGLTDNTLSLGTTAKKIKQIVVNTLRVATKFVMNTASGVISLTETGETLYNTGSKSYDTYDGSAIRVNKDDECRTFVVDSPTAANPGKVGPTVFNDPFTIDAVYPTASGSNAAGWNLRYGARGSITTSVFTDNKSASTSSNPTYTSFAANTLLNDNALELIITSRSATLQTFSATVCGHYVH